MACPRDIQIGIGSCCLKEDTVTATVTHRRPTSGTS